MGSLAGIMLPKPSEIPASTVPTHNPLSINSSQTLIEKNGTIKSWLWSCLCKFRGHLMPFEDSATLFLFKHYKTNSNTPELPGVPPLVFYRGVASGSTRSSTAGSRSPIPRGASTLPRLGVNGTSLSYVSACPFGAELFPLQMESLLTPLVSHRFMNHNIL